VLHDVHTSQCRNIVEETAEIVLGVTSRYNFRHLAILAKIAVTVQVSQGRGGHFVGSAEIENWSCDITMRVYYYQFENLELSLIFDPRRIGQLDGKPA
jgi:hypothetical protein